MVQEWTRDLDWVSGFGLWASSTLASFFLGLIPRFPVAVVLQHCHLVLQTRQIINFYWSFSCSEQLLTAVCLQVKYQEEGEIWHVLIPFYISLTLLQNLPAFFHSLVPSGSLLFVFCAKFIAVICKRISLVATYFVITRIGTKFLSFESQNLYKDSNFPVLTHL